MRQSRREGPPHVRHGTAGVRGASWRRCRSVATRDARGKAKPPTIGFLGASSPAFESQRVSAFVQRVRELGWIEGRNILIEYRWPKGRSERFAELQASSHKPAAVDHQN